MGIGVEPDWEEMRGRLGEDIIDFSKSRWKAWRLMWEHDKRLIRCAQIIDPHTVRWYNMGHPVFRAKFECALKIARRVCKSIDRKRRAHDQPRRTPEGL